MEDNKNPNNVPGVTEDTYASMLGEALNKKDAEIRALKEAHARTVRDMTEQLLERRPNEETPVAEVVPTDDDINRMRLDLFSSEVDLTNLESATKYLKLRDALLAKEGVDHFTCSGISPKEPTMDEVWRSDQTAESIRECIEYAKGDPQLFTQELQRRMKGN